MSYLECNPNHCPSIKEMGKNLVVQELKIKQLEAEKAEILRMIKELAQSETCSYRELDVILNKFGEK